MCVCVCVCVTIFCVYLFYSQSTRLKSKGTDKLPTRKKKPIPNSMPNLHRYSQHIFPRYITSFIESSIRKLKFLEVFTFDEANKLGSDLRMNKHMTQKTAD